MEVFQATENNATKTKTATSADLVMITYYTDPLCCWSWALEPQWQKVKDFYGDRIEWDYVMCGLIQDWKIYNDPMNSVTRPIQLGPVWMHASQVSGTPMDYSIWHTDPPSSSFPACVAVKCASLQSKIAGEHLLFLLRESVMTKGVNIAKSPFLFSIARSLAEKEPGIFNYEAFEMAWNNGTGADAFTADLQKARFLKIGRFPTLTFTNRNSTGIMVTGYRPFDVLRQALDQMLEEKLIKKESPSD